MESWLEQLRGDETALLMAYVAGELPAEEAAEVQRRIAADAALAARAEALGRDHAWMQEGLDRLDRQTRPPVAEELAVRRVSRMIHQWHADRLTDLPPPEERPPIKIPAWSYAVAAGLALFVGFCFWWANNPPQIAMDHPAVPPAATEPMQGVDFPGGYSPPEPPPLAFQETQGRSWERLSSIEREVNALAEPNDDLWMLWSPSNH